jgi:hypothetical protein
MICVNISPPFVATRNSAVQRRARRIAAAATVAHVQNVAPQLVESGICVLAAGENE